MIRQPSGMVSPWETTEDTVLGDEMDADECSLANILAAFLAPEGAPSLHPLKAGSTQSVLWSVGA